MSRRTPGRPAHSFWRVPRKLSDLPAGRGEAAGPGGYAAHSLKPLLDEALEGTSRRSIRGRGCGNRPRADLEGVDVLKPVVATILPRRGSRPPSSTLVALALTRQSGGRGILHGCNSVDVMRGCCRHCPDPFFVPVCVLGALRALRCAAGVWVRRVWGCVAVRFVRRRALWFGPAVASVGSCSTSVRTRDQHVVNLPHWGEAVALWVVMVSLRPA